MDRNADQELVEELRKLLLAAANDPNVQTDAIAKGIADAVTGSLKERWDTTLDPVKVGLEQRVLAEDAERIAEQASKKVSNAVTGTLTTQLGQLASGVNAVISDADIARIADAVAARGGTSQGGVDPVDQYGGSAPAQAGLDGAKPTAQNSFITKKREEYRAAQGLGGTGGEAKSPSGQDGGGAGGSDPLFDNRDVEDQAPEKTGWGAKLAAVWPRISILIFAIGVVLTIANIVLYVMLYTPASEEADEPEVSAEEAARLEAEEKAEAVNTAWLALEKKIAFAAGTLPRSPVCGTDPAINDPQPCNGWPSARQNLADKLSEQPGYVFGVVEELVRLTECKVDVPDKFEPTSDIAPLLDGLEDCLSEVTIEPDEPVEED